MGRDVGRSLLVAVIVVAGDTLFVLLTLSGRALSLSLSLPLAIILVRRLNGTICI